ncbi:MAG TPA: TonB-dependent receptor plug domain-containing protein [Bacteroidales bacterium]|nr:TonB-dependent receptor plug domain-containing protein [Bacteroidales bacterium]
MTDNTHIHNQSNSCITRDEMLAYLSGSLSATDMHRIELHMLHCDMCTDEFEGLQLLENPETISEISDTLSARIRSSIPTGKKIQFIPKKAIMIAASLVIICGIGILVLLQAPKQTQQITEYKHHIQYNPENKPYTADTSQQNNIAYIPPTSAEKPNTITSKKSENKQNIPGDNSIPEIILNQEVVKIGYASPKKEDVSQPLVPMESQDIASNPILSADQALQGKAAGVQVRSKSGTPGAEKDVTIRGIGTKSDSRPLYVVDGVPVGYEWKGDPNTIESIKILKDASSCAMYGSRGANGVIIITTTSSKPYSPATYSLGKEKDFKNYVIQTILRSHSIQSENNSIDVFCKIKQNGTIQVIQTSIRNQPDLEQSIIDILESDNNWKPATEQGNAVESNYIFTFDFTK